MPRAYKPPRLLHWKGHWHLFYFDRVSGKPKRHRCDALGAHTAKQRDGLLLRAIERDTRERMAGAGLTLPDEYGKPLTSALQEFRATLDERVRARKHSPREGLSKGAAYLLRMALDNFEAWLKRTGRASMNCGTLDGPTLEQWSLSLARGKSAATANVYRDRLRTALRWLSRRRPKVLPDPDILWPALRLRHVEPRQGQAFTPAELQAFLRRSRMELPKAKVRRKRLGQVERFVLPPPPIITPVDRLFLLLALTGMRLGEALALRWEHVDLDRGRITIHAGKTGRTRVLPLKDAPEGKVAPRFAALLAKWRAESPREHVLPHKGARHPVFSRRGWSRAQGKGDVTPQALRRNFVSYLASLNVPASVAALWTGHSAAVAERFYRQQVLERIKAASIEAAMGLDG